MAIDKNKIYQELATVMDPELGLSVMEVELIDKLEVKDDTGEVNIDFHLTSPMCPPPFALKIGYDIKQAVLRVEGTKTVKLNLEKHYMSDQLNRSINDSPEETSEKATN